MAQFADIYALGKAGQEDETAKELLMASVMQKPVSPAHFSKALTSSFHELYFPKWQIIFVSVKSVKSVKVSLCVRQKKGSSQ